MYLSSAVRAYIDVLKADSSINSNYIIAAYPYVYKPTRIDKAIITVSPVGIEASVAGVGAEKYFGDMKIRVDVYIPHEAGSPCNSAILGNIIDALSVMYPDKIEVSGITTGNDLSCYTAHCVFTHRGLIEYGGNNNG